MPGFVNPPVTAAAQNIVVPEVTCVEGTPNFQKSQAVQVQQGQAPIMIEYTMKSEGGDAVDLSGVVANAGFVRASVVEAILFSSKSNTPVIIDGTFKDAAKGVVEITITKASEITAFPGISYIEIGIFTSDTCLIFSNTIYLIINRGQFGSLTGGDIQPMGPPTIAELRLHMRDSSPTDNLWLGVVEFDLAEIAACIERPLLYFNESPPPIPQKFNTANFPYRYYWLSGVVGCLYRMAALHYHRTHLPYQAGGVAIDDKNKFKQYDAKGSQMWDEYTHWVQWKKVQLNAQNSYQTVGSQYFGRSWSR